MKKAISLRIDEEVMNLLDAVVVNTGYNRTFIIEECVKVISRASQNQTICLSDLKYYRNIWKSIIDGFQTANKKEI